MNFLVPPHGSGLAVALRAYFDASKRDSGIMSVGGFAFGISNAQKASAKWSAMMEGKVFHMTDVHNRKKEFINFTPEESGDLIEKAVPILNKYSSYTVAVSCNVNEVLEHLPDKSVSDSLSRELVNGFGSPYAFLCHTAMYIMGKMVRQAGGRDIHYVFELGDEGQPAAKRYANYLISTDANILRHNYCLTSIQHVPKDGPHVLLQSADYIAWEWGMHVKRRSNGKDIRPPLKATLKNCREYKIKYGYTMRHPSCVVTHFEGNKLAEILSYYRGMFEAETPEDEQRNFQAYEEWLSTSTL